MYQELKVKKEDSQGLLGTIIVTFVCLGIGAGLFILARNVMNGTINSVNSGNPMMGYLVMGFGGIFFICGILPKSDGLVICTTLAFGTKSNKK